MELEEYYLIVEQHFPKVDSEKNATYNSPYEEDLVQADGGVYVIYVCMLILLSTVGNIGNIMVIGAIIVSPRLRTTGNVFIANLAVADLGVTSIVHPMSIIGIIGGPKYFMDKILLCHMIAGMCFICCVCSTWNIAAIAINRYTFLVWNPVYNRIYTWRKCFMYCFMMWILCSLLDLSTYLGWGGHAFDMKTMACSYDRLSDYSFTLFFVFVAVFSPLIIVFASYVKIFLYVRKTKMAIREFHGKNKQDKKTAVKREEIQLAKTLFLVFIIFTFCWFPYALLAVLDTRDLVSRVYYLLAIQTAHTNSTFNSILYAATNKRFRHGFRMLLMMCCPSPIINVHSMFTDSGVSFTPHAKTITT